MRNEKVDSKKLSQSRSWDKCNKRKIHKCPRGHCGALISRSQIRYVTSSVSRPLMCVFCFDFGKLCFCGLFSRVFCFVTKIHRSWITNSSHLPTKPIIIVICITIVLGQFALYESATQQVKWGKFLLLVLSVCPIFPLGIAAHLCTYKP